MRKRTRKWERLVEKYFYDVYNLEDELVASFENLRDLAKYLGCRRQTINEYFCKKKSESIKIKKHIVYREINEEYGKPNGTRYYF